MALLARTTETSTQLAASLADARAYSCDVTDAESVARTFDAIQRDMGPVHTLVYNAGTGTWGTIEEIDPSILESSFRVNTLGLLLTTTRGIPQVKSQGEATSSSSELHSRDGAWRAQLDSRPRRPRREA